MLEFFVHGEAHFFQFFGVVVLEALDPLVHGAADGLEVLADFLAVLAELGFNFGRELVKFAFNPNQAFFNPGGIKFDLGGADQQGDDEGDED